MPKISPQHWKTLVRVFEQEGFSVTRTSGDHLVMHKAGHPSRVVIPKWAEVPVFIIRNNLKSAGIDLQRYFELPAEA